MCANAEGYSQKLLDFPALIAFMKDTFDLSQSASKPASRLDGGCWDVMGNERGQLATDEACCCCCRYGRDSTVTGKNARRTMG